MKKLFVIFAVFSFAATVFALDATVLKTEGKVETLQNNAWVELKEGATIPTGSVVSTGFKSECQLKIRDSVVTIQALTRITIEELTESKEKDEAQIFLSTGSLKSNIKHTEDRRTGFTVRSPVATASVRGTIFEIATAYKSTNLSTSQGTVDFYQKSEKKASKVSRGQSSTITQKGTVVSAQEKALEKVTIAQPTTAATQEAISLSSGQAIEPLQITSVKTVANEGTSLDVTVEFKTAD